MPAAKPNRSVPDSVPSIRPSLRRGSYNVLAALLFVLALVLAAINWQSHQAANARQHRALAEEYAHSSVAMLQGDLQTVALLLESLAGGPPGEPAFGSRLKTLTTALARLPADAAFRQLPGTPSVQAFALPALPDAASLAAFASASEAARKSGMPGVALNGEAGHKARIVIAIATRQGETLGLAIHATDWLERRVGQHRSWFAAHWLSGTAAVTPDGWSHAFGELAPALQLAFQATPPAAQDDKLLPQTLLISLLGLSMAFIIQRAGQRRERAEAAVDQAGSARDASEHRLQRALLLSRDGVWELNPHTNTLYLSERTRTLLGSGEAELTPQHALHLLPRPWRREVIAKLKLAGTTGESQELRFRHEDAAGGRWLRLRVRCFDEQGTRLLTGSLTDISDEMQQTTLHERYRAMLMRVIDALPVPIALHAADQTLLMMNESYATRMLLPLQTIAHQAEHRELADRIEDLGLQAISTGQPQSLQTWLPMLDGERRYLRISRALCDGIEGEPNIVASFEDITEPHLAAQQLQSERTYFQHVIDSLPNSTYVKDMHHRYILNNQAHARENGTSKLEILGKRSHDFTPEAAAAIEEAEDQLLASPNGTIVEREMRLEQHGVVRHVVIRKVRIEDANGKPVLLGTNADVTRLREAEAGLRDHAERQSHLHQFLQSVFDAVPHPLFVKNHEHRYIISNRAHAESVGAASVADVLGKRSADFVDASVAAEIEAAEDALFSRGSHDIINGEFILPHRTGSTRHVILYKALCINADGQTVLVGVNTDITRMREVEEGLRMHRDQLAQLVRTQTLDLVRANEITEQAREARARLVSDVSGSLRAPLNDIFETARRADGASMDNGLQRDALARIRSSSETMLEQMAMLLRSVRDESHHGPLALRPALLDHLVQDVAIEFHTWLVAKRQQLRVSVAGPLPPLQADKTLLCTALRQIFKHVIDTAADGEDILLSLGVPGAGGAVSDAVAMLELRITYSTHHANSVQAANVLAANAFPDELTRARDIIGSHRGTCDLSTLDGARSNARCIRVRLPARTQIATIEETVTP